MSCKNLNKETLLNIEEIRRLIWPGRKIVFLAHITLLNCMQDDLLIEYEVYQIAHEMWQTLKEKYGGFSTIELRELVMKFGNYKMQSNHTMKQHLREMKKNKESLIHLGVSLMMSNKLRRSSNLYQRVRNTWW